MMSDYNVGILVLAEDAIKAALADYKTKKEKASKG